MPGDTYTHGHEDAVLRSHRWRTVDNSAAYLVPRLVPGCRLLDVGCGPGTLTVDLARHVAPGDVVGVDAAAAVVEEAAAHAAEAGVSNASFVTGDFREVGFDAGTFDVVHAHQVLQHLADPVGALAAMARLAAPGGVVAVRDSDYGAFTWAPASAAIERWLALYHAVTARNRAEADAGRWLPRWAREAGLGSVTYTTSTWTFATPGDVGWWSELWAERTTSSTFARQAVSYGLATDAELEGMAAGWRAWAMEPDALFIVLHGELVATVG